MVLLFSSASHALLSPHVQTVPVALPYADFCLLSDGGEQGYSGGGDK